MPEPCRIVACGPERADVVHRLTQAAFAGYGHIDPPSGALRETVDTVAEDLAAGGGALAESDDTPVGCLRWKLRDDGDLYVGRLAVDPSRQGRGVGRALMTWAEAEARRRDRGGVAVGVRVALPETLAFYEALGYVVVGEERHAGYDRTTALAVRKALADE